MFGTIYYLYVLSMLWTLLSAQENDIDLCGLSGKNIAGLTKAFSIGEFLYVGNGTHFYPMQVATLRTSLFVQRIIHIFPGNDLKSVTSAIHFRDIGCQNVTCIKAKDLVIAFGETEQTSAYRSYRYNLTGQNEVTAITDESHMPWDLPPSGNLSDFNRVILANQSVYLRFVGAFFDRSFKTLYFLHNVSNDSSKSELTYRKLGRDGNFNKSVEIQKTNSFERVDMVAALPGDPWDQVYAITHNRIGPIVNELSVWNAGRAGLGYQMIPLKEFFNCYGNSTLITPEPVYETPPTTDVNDGSGSGGGSGDFEITTGDSGETPGPDHSWTTTMKSTMTPTMTSKSSTTPLPQPKKKNWLIWVIIGIILALIIAAIIFFLICWGSKSNEEQATPKPDAPVPPGPQASVPAPEAQAPPGSISGQAPPAGTTGAPEVGSQVPPSETSDTLRPVDSGEVSVDSVRSSEV